jgi:heptosyltransferase-2
MSQAHLTPASEGGSGSRGTFPRRILVRGVNWLGDAVMSTPALLRLREAQPTAQITLLTPGKLRDLWLHHPAVDDVLEFGTEGLLTVASRLRAGGFDTALLLPNSPRSALEVFLAGIPQRVGAVRPWRNLLLTTKVPRRPGEVRMHKRSAGEVRRRIAELPTAASLPALPPQAHHIHHYLHLAAALGANPAPLAPRIVVTRPEVDAVRQRFQAPAETMSSPLFGLNAGAEYGPAKRWPMERFVEAAVILQRQTGCTWWVLGGPAEVPLASAIAEQIAAAKAGPPSSVRCLAGQTSLRDLCAILRACAVVLTNDSGPMHLAAAVGTSVVTPFGSTSPELTAPGFPPVARGEQRPSDGPSHQFLQAPVPCAPCFRRDCPIDLRCMTGISVESVVAAVRWCLESRKNAINAATSK